MESLLEYIDSNKLVNVYGISKLGTTIKSEYVRLSLDEGRRRWTENNTFNEKVVFVNFCRKDGRPKSTFSQHVVDFRFFDDNSFCFGNLKFYLNPTEACNIIINRIKKKKRYFDKKQMEAQKIAASWKK